MALYKVTVYSTENVVLTIATSVIRRIMNWDFFRAHRFCQEAGDTGSRVLCIAGEEKALQYVEQLEEQSIFAECVPI